MRRDLHNLDVGDVKEKQRFSIRKYAIGVASVLIGLALVGPMVAADTVTSEEQAITASAVDTAQTTEENHPAKEEEVGKTEAPSLSSALDSDQTEGIQPSDKGNEPVKGGANEPDKVMIISSLFLIPQRK